MIAIALKVANAMGWAKLICSPARLRLCEFVGWEIAVGSCVERRMNGEKIEELRVRGEK